MKKSEGAKRGRSLSGVPQEPKYMAIQELRQGKGWPIQKICHFLGVCRAAYYKWLRRRPSDRQLFDEDLAEKIKGLYWEQNGILGYRQMTIALNRRHGLHCNAKRIYRLMTILGLSSVCRRKRRYRNKTRKKIARSS